MKLLKLVNNFCSTTTCSSNVFKSQDLNWKQVATHGSHRRAYSRAWPRWKGTAKEIKQAQGLADKDGISSHGLKDHGRGTVFPKPMSQAIAAGQGFVNKHFSSSSSRCLLMVTPKGPYSKRVHMTEFTEITLQAWRRVEKGRVDQKRKWDQQYTIYNKLRIIYFLWKTLCSLGIVVHAYNIISWEMKAEELGVGGQPRLSSENLLKISKGSEWVRMWLRGWAYA